MIKLNGMTHIKSNKVFKLNGMTYKDCNFKSNKGMFRRKNNFISKML